MNRVGPSHVCLICGRWIEDDYLRATDHTGRASALRQMRNGLCDECQRERHSAALEYIAAADAIRLAWAWTLQAFGDDAIDYDPLIGGRMPQGWATAGTAAWLRMNAAAERCVALGMW
jgi:hypothetical protein